MVNVKPLGIFASCLLLVALIFGAFGCDKEATTQKQPADPTAKVKKSASAGEVTLVLSETDRQYLIGVARKALETWTREQKSYQPKDVPAHLQAMRVNRVFATLYKEGEWRGCVSAKGKSIVPATVQSVINTCRDRRFKDPQPDELDRFRVELSYLQPKELIESKDPATIGTELEPGVHGIILDHKSGKRAFFLPYVFVKKQRTTVTWLERIAKKAGLPKNAWLSPEASLYRYNTINFIEDVPNGRAVDLYRYKVELDQVEAGSVEAAIERSVAWFAARKQENGLLLSGYTTDHKPMRTGDPRLQLMAAMALGYQAESAKNPALGNDVRHLLDALKEYVVPGENVAPVWADNDGEDLEGTLIAAELFTLSGAPKDRQPRVKALGEALRDMLKEVKSLPENGELLRDLPNYAVFTLANLAAFTKDDDDKAFALRFYSKNWKPGRAWSLAAASAIALLSEQRPHIEAVRKEAEALMATQYTTATAPYRDYIGAFKSPHPPVTVEVALRLRGMALALFVLDAARQPALLKSMALATRWLLEQQFTEISAFYFHSYKDAVGAFKRDILVNTTRLDDTAAALLALTEIHKRVGPRLDATFAAMTEELKK